MKGWAGSPLQSSNAATPARPPGMHQRPTNGCGASQRRVVQIMQRLAAANLLCDLCFHSSCPRRNFIFTGVAVAGRPLGHDPAFKADANGLTRQAR
jgi:hypothetical protein